MTVSKFESAGKIHLDIANQGLVEFYEMKRVGDWMSSMEQKKVEEEKERANIYGDEERERRWKRLQGSIREEPTLYEERMMAYRSNEQLFSPVYNTQSMIGGKRARDDSSEDIHTTSKRLQILPASSNTSVGTSLLTVNPPSLFHSAAQYTHSFYAGNAALQSYGSSTSSYVMSPGVIRLQEITRPSLQFRRDNALRPCYSNVGQGVRMVKVSTIRGRTPRPAMSTTPAASYTEAMVLKRRLAITNEAIQPTGASVRLSERSSYKQISAAHIETLVINRDRLDGSDKLSTQHLEVAERGQEDDSGSNAVASYNRKLINEMLLERNSYPQDNEYVFMQ